MHVSVTLVVSVLAAAQSFGQTAPPAAPAATPAPAAAAGPAAEIPGIRLERVWRDLKTVRPTQMIPVPGSPGRWLLIEQPGTIRLLDEANGDVTEAPLVVDLRQRVNDRSNEEGLLSAAFHPDFPKRPELYVYYTAAEPRRSVLGRFTVAPDGSRIDETTEEVILEQSQPYWNHNGGTVLFGPDGFLYLSLGDGGAANDPKEFGQNMKSWLAKILRIDVNRKADGKNYAVPADNPFVGKEDVLPEIWASGLRNVWRMHFDSKTGELWAGDVGQNAWEEIDLIVKGGNYGWNRREGFHGFGRVKDTEKSYAGGEFIDPVVDYSHQEGVSVTGGFVYRGKNVPGLDGTYLYADFAIPKIWGLRMMDGKPTKPKLLLRPGGSMISSFAEAPDGTLYVLSFEGGQNPGQAGAIWRIEPAKN
jgi:glucose/arabinose dehydrogenase